MPPAASSRLSPSLRRLPARFAALAAAVLFAVLAAATPAGAHAALVGAEPGDGSLVDAAPARFVLRFSEPVVPLVLRLAMPGGRSAVLRAAEANGSVITVEAPPELGRGTHALSYRVASEDGHPVGGSVLFSIGEATGAPGRDAAFDGPVAALVFATKLLLYLALFFGVGGAAYGAAVESLAGGAAHVARGFLLIGLGAAPLALGAQGLDALGAPIADILRPSIWQAGAATNFGRTVALAALAFVLGFFATGRWGGATMRRSLAALALASLGLGLALAGHAASAPPQWLTRPAVFLHGVAIAAWVGALLPLAIAVQRGDLAGRAALRRFSKLIPVAVAVLLASGVTLAVVQVGRPAALWETGYGRVLLAKLALLALLFALAAFNRWRLTAPVVAGGDAAATERLVGVVAMETALVLFVLATATLWRFTPPPRALAEAAAVPALAHFVSGAYAADVAAVPGRAGPVTLSARLATIDYAPVNPRSVRFVLTNPAAGIEPLRRDASRRADGTFAADLALPAPGRWHLRLDVLIDDFTQAAVEGELDIRP